MALSISMNSVTTTGYNQVTISASWFNADGLGTDKYTQVGDGNPPDHFAPDEAFHGTASPGVNGSINQTRTGLTSDFTYYCQAAVVDTTTGSKFTSVTAKKTWASVAVMPTPTSSSVTSSTATITTGSFTPNVVQSTWVATLYYKRTTDPSYTVAGSTSSSNPLAVNLTGLDSSTQYNFYSEIVRTTVNLTTTTSAVASFTTAAGVPTVTTGAASSVSHSTATLNNTVVVNAGTNVQSYWKYGIQNPPTDSTTASQASSSDASYSVGITGLTASTLYYAQAFVSFDTPSGTPSSGSVVSFTTSANPSAEAADEDHMTIQEYDAVYGVQKAFVFLAASPAASSSNTFLSAAAPWATTECRITIDGGAVADCTNAPTRIGTSAFYTITLTAAELAGENIWVHIADTGVAARDVALHIRTSIEVGKMVLNASAMTNTTALAATGIGSGHGASFVAGATGKDIDGTLGEHLIRKSTATAGGASTVTLDASASATNDFYNGAVILIISGTGAGQARLISGYAGATQVATVHRAWATVPANGDTFMIIPVEDVWTQAATAELSAMPSATSTWANKLAFLFQRFAYKRTQTATVHTMLKADSSTSLVTAAVSDSAGTQSFGKLS